MPSGNGARKKQQQERKLHAMQKAGVKHTTEDLKKHEESKNAVQCTICLQGFPRTVRRPELEQHLESRHAKISRTLEDVFPMFAAS